MGYESQLPAIFDFVKRNPKMTATQISRATGINELTVHRHLTGGRGKINQGLFIREKVIGKRIDKGNRVRGTFHYLYSVNPKPEQKVKEIVKEKRGFKPSQLNNFIFGQL
jgi:predicted transcriptional regulator